MKILIVCSVNSSYISPFILEQVDAIQKLGVTFEYFTIKGKGFLGYLANLSLLKEKVKEVEPDLIHAHYGFSGLLATLQRKCPVIITFHGSDINQKRNRVISFLASRLSRFNIYVHPDLPKKIFDNRGFSIIPCGVNLEILFPIEKQKARKILGLDRNKIYGLFSSSFTNGIKNYPLAKKSLSLIDTKIELIELKGYTRERINYLMNAADFLLVTSFSETGPLVVKEAMSCNCPIVSTNVGDVKEVIGKTEGCYIASFNPKDVADKIKKAISFGIRTIGREDIKHFESKIIAQKIISIYKKMLEF